MFFMSDGTSWIFEVAEHGRINRGRLIFKVWRRCEGTHWVAHGPSPSTYIQSCTNKKQLPSFVQRCSISTLRVTSTSKGCSPCSLRSRSSIACSPYRFSSYLHMISRNHLGVSPPSPNRTIALQFSDRTPPLHSDFKLPKFVVSSLFQTRT